MTKRSRPDIEPTVFFLTTRVSKSNVDDWNKLKRCITWVGQTDSDVRLIRASTLEELYIWIDVAFAVHPNGRSHTRGGISLGVGMIYCRSGKQKLNTKSSTELELVGTSEYLPYNILFMYFFKAQGYPIKKDILLAQYVCRRAVLGLVPNIHDTSTLSFCERSNRLKKKLKFSFVPPI